MKVIKKIKLNQETLVIKYIRAKGTWLSIKQLSKRILIKQHNRHDRNNLFKDRITKNTKYLKNKLKL